MSILLVNQPQLDMTCEVGRKPEWKTHSKEMKKHDKEMKRKEGSEKVGEQDKDRYYLQLVRRKEGKAQKE